MELQRQEQEERSALQKLEMDKRNKLQLMEIEQRKKEMAMLTAAGVGSTVRSLFTTKHHYQVPTFGDGDSDLDKHLAEFAHYCKVASPSVTISDGDKLQLFATTLTGAKKKLYDDLYLETLESGEFLRNPPKFTPP